MSGITSTGPSAGPGNDVALRGGETSARSAPLLARPGAQVPRIEGRRRSRRRASRPSGGRGLVSDDPGVDRRFEVAMEGLFRTPVPCAELRRRVRALPSPGTELVLVFVENEEEASTLRWLRTYRLLPPFLAFASAHLSEDGRSVLRECATRVVLLRSWGSSPTAEGRPGTPGLEEDRAVPGPITPVPLS